MFDVVVGISRWPHMEAVVTPRCGAFAGQPFVVGLQGPGHLVVRRRRRSNREAAERVTMPTAMASFGERKQGRARVVGVCGSLRIQYERENDVPPHAWRGHVVSARGPTRNKEREARMMYTRKACNENQHDYNASPRWIR